MEEDREDKSFQLQVHTPEQAGEDTRRVQRQAMESLLETVPSAAMLWPTAVEPHFIVVPVEVRAAADQDRFGELLPPPVFVRDRIAPRQVPHAPASPLGLLSTPEALRASAPLVFRLPGRTDLAEEFIFLNGKLQAQKDPGTACRHCLVSGDTTIMVCSGDPKLNLDLFVGRNVEVLARCGAMPRELQITALHPID